MTTAPTGSLVVLALEDQRFALDLSVVERVVRAVEITPLPGAPLGVCGVINLQGRVVPVFDVRGRFGLPPRALRAEDHLVIARTRTRLLALIVDAVVEVVEREEAELTPVSEILEIPDGTAAPRAVFESEGSLVLVEDLEDFLSAPEHAALELALAR